MTSDKSTNRYISITNVFFFGLISLCIKRFQFRENLDGSIDEVAISKSVMEKAVADFLIKETYWRPGYYDHVIYNTAVFFTGIGKWGDPDPESKYFSFKELKKEIENHEWHRFG